jgi:hypothetical protein
MGGKKIEVDEDDLKAMVADAVKGSASSATVAAEAIKQVFGISGDQSTIEQRTHAQLGTPVPPRTLLSTVTVPCRNPRNGATFTAIVTPSREFPEGRTVRLEDYQYPDDLEARAQKAGWKPDRVFTSRGGSHRDYRAPGKLGFHMGTPLTPGYPQWRAETYFQADLKAFVGQSMALLPKCGEPVEWKAENYAREVGSAVLT